MNFRCILVFVLFILFANIEATCRDFAIQIDESTHNMQEFLEKEITKIYSQLTDKYVYFKGDANLDLPTYLYTVNEAKQQEKWVLNTLLSAHESTVSYRYVKVQ